MLDDGSVLPDLPHLPILSERASQSKMEVQLAPETHASLKADTTIRFFYRVKFKLDSRHSVPVIAWAESRANTVCCAILKHIGREAAPVKIQMLIVELLRVRKYALLCFDLSSEDCTKPAPLQRPIHEIHKRGNAYVVFRSGRLDARIAREFAKLQDSDKGPLPYFVDTMNPPLYDGGVRVEGPFNAGESEDGYKSEEENKSTEENTSEEANKLEEENKSKEENKSEEEKESKEENKSEEGNESKEENKSEEGNESKEENKSEEHESEEKNKLEGMNTPPKVEGMMNEQMRGKLEVDKLNQ